MLHTLCQNIRFKRQELIESYYECNFSFCSFIFCEAEDKAFVARIVIIFLNKQNSFSDRFIACLSQKYLLQWTSEKIARNRNIEYVLNCVIWNSSAGVVFGKTMFSTHHFQEGYLGSLEKAGSYLFSVNIFRWLKQGLNLLDIIISLYPRICTELNNSACLNCQYYHFKSLQRQGVHCKFDNAVGYRSVAFKMSLKILFGNGRIRDKPHILWHYLQSSCSDYLWKKQP